MKDESESETEAEAEASGSQINLSGHRQCLYVLGIAVAAGLAYNVPLAFSALQISRGNTCCRAGDSRIDNFFQVARLVASHVRRIHHLTHALKPWSR